jgi:hypothetical protein
MVSEKLEREIPFCTIFLVLGAVIFQTITLVGNCKTGTALHNIGGSVSGWSLVGLGLSKSFGEELNTEVEKVQTDLTEAIVKIEKAEEDLDSLLSIFGVHIDVHVNKSVSLLMEQEEVHGDPLGAIMGGIMSVIGDIPKLHEVNGLLANFLNEITPALEVVGGWILKFGPKIQAFVSQMGTTIDRAQKNFDKMMQHMMSSTGEEAMMFNTFNLYDMEHTGSISLFDVHEVGSSYAINAYQGEAGTKLFKKYAGNNSLIEKGPEFTAFVSDPTTPYVMSILLRAYSQKMSEVGGLVKHAVKRSDMSYAVSQYLQLTCARNLTRADWVATMLTNGTLPIPFTATVLVQLAYQKGNPNALTTVDIGEMVVGAMVLNNLTAVLLAVDQLAEPSFFTTEGFDVSTQPDVLEIVSGWVLTGPALWKEMVQNVGLSTLEVGDAKSDRSVSLMKIFEEMPKVARRLSQKNVKKHRQQRAANRIVKRQRNFKTKTQEMLLLHLTGGRAMADVVMVESAAEQVVNGGVPCVPVTLEWAKWLSHNATVIAEGLNALSTDYSKTSSSTTQSFNTQIQGITKKISSFIGVMESYSTPAGIAKLKAEIENFEEKALNDVLAVVEKTIVNLVTNELSSLLGTKPSLLQTGASSVSNRSAMKTKAGSHERAHQLLAMITAERDRRQAQKEAEGTEISHVWAEVQTLMGEVMNLMPSAVNAISTAKSDVQMVYATLEGIFSVLSVKGPGIFEDAAILYKLIWVFYWFLITPFTIGILFYGFWANGWMGGPKAYDTTEYAAPQTFGEYMSCCYRGCCACMTGCCDSHLCFWSFVMIMQVVALVLFLMSIVFTIIGGVDILLATGCAEIYVITDDKICQTSMHFMQSFLSTFKIGAASGLNPMTEACNNHNLLLCEKIQTDLINSATYTIIGSFLSCAFTFQLIFDTAVLHERARWRRIADELTKEV